MGMYKKMLIDKQEKRSRKAIRVYEDTHKMMRVCKNGCSDINKMCPACEADYMEWASQVEQDYQDEIKMLEGK